MCAPATLPVLDVYEGAHFVSASTSTRVCTIIQLSLYGHMARGRGIWPGVAGGATPMTAVKQAGLPVPSELFFGEKMGDLSQHTSNEEILHPLACLNQNRHFHNRQ